MEDKIRLLFDYQKFEQNQRLAALIAKTEEAYGDCIAENDLESINAAGGFYVPAQKEDTYE